MRWDLPTTPTRRAGPTEVHVEEGERAALPKTSVVKNKKPGIPQADQQTNFLSILENILTTIDNQNLVKDIQNFQIALMQLEIADPGFTSKFFFDVMKTWKEDFPEEFYRLFNA
jgi:hypothetical protein